MPEQPVPVSRSPHPRARSRSRVEFGAVAVTGRQALATGGSGRGAAAAQGLPKTTFFRILARMDAVDPDPTARAFFDGLSGQRVLHRLVLVLLVVMVFRAGLGVGMVRLVLVMAGLSRRVACSDSHLRGKVVAMRRMMLEFEQEETASLAPRMPHRSIVLCPDEMFRCGTMILTALEPVSGMALVHRIATHRDALTWDEAIRHGTQGLRVTLVALCADSAGGIQSAATERLKVRFDPELFHALKGLSDAFWRPLRSWLAAAHKARSKAALHALRVQVQGAASETADGAAPSPLQVEAARELDAAQTAMRESQGAQETLHKVRQTLSLVLHPVDLLTGALRDPDEVALVVEDQLHSLDPLAERLGHKCRVALASAREKIPAWTAMVSQWGLRVRERVAQEVLSVELQTVMLTALIPACYLAWVSTRNHLPTRVRAYLRTQSDGMFRQVAANPEWASLPHGLRVHLESVAQECARWFVRCSSGTEGHNQWTARRLHRDHGVRGDWLAALKVVHNFMLVRADGTTAAQRFYGRAHGDLLEYLEARMPLPAFPRTRKSRPRPDPLGLAP